MSKIPSTETEKNVPRTDQAIEHSKLGDTRKPGMALPKTVGYDPEIHGPEVGHRPEGQTIHE